MCDKDYIVSIDCFQYYGHFNNTNSSSSWTGYIVPLLQSSISLMSDSFQCTDLHLLGDIYS